MTVVRAMTPEDWPSVERIYADAIRGGEATFETDPPTWAEFDAHRIPRPRLVADEGGDVVGWVAASPASRRAAYDGVIDHSIYLRHEARGRGVGTRLLRAFIPASEDEGYWTIQSSVFPENRESLRLHGRFGFRVVGRRERVARSVLGPHAGQWRDALIIERRSMRVGC